jgi:hypothetical protein
MATKSEKAYRAKEIDTILGALKDLWKQVPDQRLGQLLENYVFINGERGDATSVKLFYQLDLRTYARIKKAIKVIKDGS